MNEGSDSKLVTRKVNIANDQSNVNYDVGNEIIFNTEVLKYNLFYYNDPYILVRVDITIADRSLVTEVALKNCALFTKCITN